MATTRFTTTLTAFLGGTLAAVLPALGFSILLFTIGGCVLAPRVRLLLALALAAGYTNGTLSVHTASLPPALPPVFGGVLLHAQPVGDAGGTAGAASMYRLALDYGPTIEGYFAPGRILQPGTHLRLRGRVIAFDEARNPGAPSPAALAADRGVAFALVRGRVIADDGVQARDSRSWIPLAQAWATGVLTGRLTPIQSGVMRALLWGDHDGVPGRLHAAFATTGTVHVLTPAGLHIGLLCAIALALFRRATFGRTATAALTLVLITAYALFTGGHVPARRATAACALVLGARAAGTQTALKQGLLLVAAGICALNPRSIMSLAFWLSFACVASMLAFTPGITRRLTAQPGWVCRGIAVALAAQLGTWPLILYAEHSVGFTSTAANVIVVPLAAIAFAAGGLLLTITAAAEITHRCIAWPANTWVAGPAGTVVHELGAVAQIFFGYAAAICTAGIRCSVDICVRTILFFAQLPHSSVSFAPPGYLALLGSYILLALAAWRINEPRGYAFMIARVTAMPLLTRYTFAQKYSWARRMQSYAILWVIFFGAEVLPLSAGITHLLPAHLRVTILDVGQGDGIVIETPRHHTILIDTGGRLELHAGNAVESPAEKAAAAVLLPFLSYEGITRIDVLLLTHPHGDHVGGAAPVLRSMPVGVIYDSGQRYTGRAFLDTLAAARTRRVPIHIARRGDTFITDDGVRFDVLAPFATPLADKRNAINEGSIIVRVSYGNHRMLFTGDAGMPTEERLLAAHDDLRADILKVGHHGSAGASSPQFLGAVNASLAVISVGRHNLFHHPALPTIAHLVAAHDIILRTDQCGGITLDMSALRVATTLPCADIQKPPAESR